MFVDLQQRGSNDLVGAGFGSVGLHHYRDRIATASLTNYCGPSRHNDGRDVVHHGRVSGDVLATPRRCSISVCVRSRGDAQQRSLSGSGAWRRLLVSPYEEYSM